MALKPHRNVAFEDISYFVNSLTGLDPVNRMERGGILCATTGTPGSGDAMDTAANSAEYAIDPSGRMPLGILDNDFVNLDLSRLQVNPYKDEAQIGNKACIIRFGTVVTNMLVPGQGAISVPTAAYVGPSGLITSTAATGRATIGQLLTRPDADGFAKVRVAL